MYSKHGTYRPNLPGLVASNSDEDILSTTKRAFATYQANNDALIESIEILANLKGIGPATASLLLSCYDPTKVPFFSDHLFRYVLFKRMKDHGWDRKIKYNTDEYRELPGKVQALQNRLEGEGKQPVSIFDLEKAAYVLRKRKRSDIQYEPINDNHEDQEEAANSTESEKKRKDASAEDDRTNDQIEEKPDAKRRKTNTTNTSEADTYKPSLIPRSEKEDNYPSEASEDDKESIRRDEECLRKGPHGSPTYDTLGYQLDFDYIRKTSHRPRRSKGHSDKMMAHCRKRDEERERKAQIMGAEGSSSNVLNENVWNDIVARDLGVPFHTVGMEEFEEWARRGGKAEVREYKELDGREQKRLMRLQTGCALRVGSRHRA